MSEMETSDAEAEQRNDLELLDRVFLRLGNADTDTQLESCLTRFLPPVILKLSSPHEIVRKKVMEVLVHVNKRAKSRGTVQIPVELLLINYTTSENSFVTNFSMLYITMGFPRLTREKQIEIAPTMLNAIENKPKLHQEGILFLLMPLLGDLELKQLLVEQKPMLGAILLEYATKLLLLPYRALPSERDLSKDFETPPGFSLTSYKTIVDKHSINADQLEQIKLSIVNFISKDIFKGSDVLLPLIVAAADSRFSVANQANSPLIRTASSIDWSVPANMLPLYKLFLGSFTREDNKPVEDKMVPACTRLRLKLLPYMNRGTGPGILFPHCVPLVYTFFERDGNSRLKGLVLNYLLNLINHGNPSHVAMVAEVYMQALYKIIRSEPVEFTPKALQCLGKLTSKYPDILKKELFLLSDLVERIPNASPEVKLALRDCILEMAVCFDVTRGDDDNYFTLRDRREKEDAADPSETKRAKPSNPSVSKQSSASFVLLDKYMHHDDGMIRYIAMRYAAVIFEPNYIPSRYLLLLACGDSQDEVSTEAKKYLYGVARTNEIDDVVNNVRQKETTVGNTDQPSTSKFNNAIAEFMVPNFKEVVNYIWQQIEIRKKGSNSKQRFVVNNEVLQFHPNTYKEMLRYLRMCLNHDAGLKDCSNHPNATSPILTKYIQENLLNTDVLDKYLTMITNMLSSPDPMPLTCFLDIVGCASEQMAHKYKKMLSLFKTIFTNSNNEDVREISSKIYAIIKVNTSNKAEIDKEIEELLAESQLAKRLESQCGFISAFSNICERCIALSRKGKQFGGKGFSSDNWGPFKNVTVTLVKLMSSTQNMLVSVSCTNIALLGRITALPIPNCLSEQEAKINTENPFDIGIKPTVAPSNGEGVSKFSIVDQLFKIVLNSKLPSKIKEKALYTLGILCCGEKFPFAKQIISGFLLMAKDSKEFEIHLQVGESLVICIEGVNSDENRDMWTQLPASPENKVKDPVALAENDEVLEWLLQELFALAKQPHPHSRQATSIWLLALLKNCGDRKPIQGKLQIMQNVFMDFLSENSDIVQDVASKGLTLVYQNSSESQQKELVGEIIEQLTSGKRSVAQVTADTKIFEEGQLGKAPTGGNLSTYKELCSLASDLNQPDLLYKFMHLAHHNSVWNSKKGAAFGFQSIASQAGEQLTEHLPKIVPRLYRYRFDPTPKIQLSMTSIWQAIVPETQKTVHKYHKEILEDLVTNLTSNQWRVRMSCCNALTELLRGARSLHDSLEHLPTLWRQLFRVMDDVHEGTRQAATSTTNVLSKLCVQASDANQMKDGKLIMSAILPPLLDVGITNVVAEVRNVSLQTVSKLVTAAGDGLKHLLPSLIPALVTAAGELESSKLSYLSTALGTDSGTREVLDDMRATAARHHYTVDTVVKCMPYVTIEIMTEMLPKMLELMKSPQLGTKVACCHFFILSAQHLRRQLEPIAGKIMAHLINGSFDRNPTVRKNCSEALGQVSAYAKSSSVEKLMSKLVSHNEDKDDEVTRSAIGLILKSVSKANIEMIKDNEAIIAPLVYFSIHAPKDEEKATVEMYEEIWADISPGSETGLRAHLGPICQFIENALASRSWTKKTQAAIAIKHLQMNASSGLGNERLKLIRSVLAALQGKTYDGKQYLLDALAQLCLVKPDETALPQSYAEEAMNALMAECHKQDLVYKKHALNSLGTVLVNHDFDRFQQVYEIVKVILSKDDSSMDDSDDENKDSSRERREQLQALKDEAYVLLGRAFPKNRDTQEKYQEQFFAHCSTSYRKSSRTTQMSILSAVRAVIRMVFLMNVKPEPPKEELKAVCKQDLVNQMAAHVTDIIDYTLANTTQSRHKKEVLELMQILITKLRELEYLGPMPKLQSICEAHVADLSKDSSYEVRAALDDVKKLFQ